MTEGRSCWGGFGRGDRVASLFEGAIGQVVEGLGGERARRGQA
jgi:hypothetical protein